MIDTEALDILLVEDNDDDLEMTLHALRKVNLAEHVGVARDGAEALDMIFCRGAHAQRLNWRLPRLIMLDLKLPKIDGLEVLTEIKVDPLTRNIPVVMLTSSKEQSDILRSYALGVNSYIVKPVTYAQFAQAVQDAGLYWMLLNQPPKA